MGPLDNTTYREAKTWGRKLNAGQAEDPDVSKPVDVKQVRYENSIVWNNPFPLIQEILAMTNDHNSEFQKARRVYELNQTIAANVTAFDQRVSDGSLIRLRSNAAMRLSPCLKRRYSSFSFSHIASHTYNGDLLNYRTPHEEERGK